MKKLFLILIPVLLLLALGCRNDDPGVDDRLAVRLSGDFLGNCHQEELSNGDLSSYNSSRQVNVTPLDSNSYDILIIGGEQFYHREGTDPEREGIHYENSDGIGVYSFLDTAQVLYFSYEVSGY